ncbi:MAG: hypothetical protein OEY09_20030 [Gammaproteobacteria bacterium]|nr:hypothetical protein [Gammaproteobacteria bacterium]
MQAAKPVLTLSILTLLVANILPVSAQENSSHTMKHDEHAAMHGMVYPALSGQGAFGAIQEIIGILEADPATDWSRVNITGLREHLVDMNRLVMDAVVEETSVNDGLEITVTGNERTLRAIQAMVPAHASVIDGLNGWKVRAEVKQDGARLTVTSEEAGEAAHIQGLGFFGLMATGSHHQRHHLALARGGGMHGE